MQHAALRKGVLLDREKLAIITLILRNARFNPDSVASYWLVINLAFLSKVVVVFRPTYLLSHLLLSPMLSDFHEHHLTEMAILIIVSDIFVSITNIAHVTTLALL